MFWTAPSRPLFLSTLSLRRATTTTITICIVSKFLSTLSLRRATHYDNYNLHCVEISIHALLAESDPSLRFLWCRFCHFYPRSPCGERRLYYFNFSWFRDISIHALLAESDINSISLIVHISRFLSTLSLRRATLELFLYYQDNRDFYPRSPCGERRKYHRADRERACISIHALLAESDTTKI